MAGSRGYDDYAAFSSVMNDYVSEFIEQKDSVIFISGDARTGADAMIIRWCKENDYPWVEFPARWDDLEAPGAVILENRRTGKPYNARAGYDRNEAMGNVATNLVIFWDGRSKGTKQMRDFAGTRKLKILTVLIDIAKKDDDHGWKQTGRASGDIGVRGEATPWLT